MRGRRPLEALRGGGKNFTSTASSPCTCKVIHCSDSEAHQNRIMLPNMRCNGSLLGNDKNSRSKSTKLKLSAAARRSHSPMFTSSSVSASPMHSNWNSCRDCENFCTATERSAGQREAESEESTAELPLNCSVPNPGLHCITSPS